MPLVPYFVSLCLSLASLRVYALPWDGAQRTSVQPELDYHGTSPVPTQAPDLKDLVRRQNANQVCGFINADINSPITCAASYVCAINTYNSAAGCCVNPYNCDYHSACVPYASMGNCGASCLANVYLTKCSNVNYPYCYFKKYFLTNYANPFYEIDCAAAPGTLTVYQTYTNKVIQTPVSVPNYVIITTTATTQPVQSQSQSQVVNSNPNPASGSSSQIAGSSPAPKSSQSVEAQVASSSSPSPSPNNVVVNCDNSGANSGTGNGGVTCVVGNGNGKSPASQRLPGLGSGGIIIRIFTIWTAVELLSRILL